MKKPSEEMVGLLRRAGDHSFETACAAQQELAKALTLPLRQGILKGDIVSGIFETVYFAPGTAVEFPLDFLAPGTEKDFIAYTVPAQGRIPEKHVSGDFVMVPTYEVADSIDFALKYARDARWDIVGRCMQVLEAGFVRKMNDDGWRTIISAGKSRNLTVYDAAATPGLFTKRLIALMKTIMRRNAGGNSTSVNRGHLTDLYVSPEAMEDMRSWDLAQVDDFTRREIYVAGEGNNEFGQTKIFGVNLHDIDELGVGQDYQSYFIDTLSGTVDFGSANDEKLELAVGLDLEKDDSFVMPWRQEIEVFEDPTFHRQRRAGFYGFGEYGFSVLDNRRVLLGAL
jgi:hypothetical protein